MFPDSEIAKSYAQKADKIKYMMLFRIAPVIRDIILDDLKGKPFSLLFDETTTSQIKKQWDGYATFFSDHFNQTLPLIWERCSLVNVLLRIFWMT